jgi:hypothetical protein
MHGIRSISNSGKCALNYQTKNLTTLDLIEENWGEENFWCEKLHASKIQKLMLCNRHLFKKNSRVINDWQL